MTDPNQLVGVLINVGVVALAIVIVSFCYRWIRGRKEKKHE